jgi:hypothetical protein
MHFKLSIQIIVISCAIFYVGCQASSNSGDKIKGIPTGSLSDFVQNPVSASGTDTINVARMDFSEPVFDFGTVDEGDVVEHEFSFTNTGKLPLIISTANSTCGCTVPEWPKEPIESGESASVMVRFNTLGKPNNQTKPVSIFANTYPNETKVYLKGHVKPKQE